MESVVASDCEPLVGAMLRWVAETHPGELGHITSMRRSVLLEFARLLSVELSDGTDVSLVAIQTATKRWVCFAEDDLEWPWPIEIV